MHMTTKFFHQKHPPDPMIPKQDYFSNINSHSSRYSNLKVILHILQILFIQLVQSNCLFLVGLGLVESVLILTCICTDFTRNARKVEYFGNYSI
jgi:hypothetical protein